MYTNLALSSQKCTQFSLGLNRGLKSSPVLSLVGSA